MRLRVAQFVCLLLLLSSLAVSDVRANTVASARTPGGVFIRNLVLRASVEEAETSPLAFGRAEAAKPVREALPAQPVVCGATSACGQAAHVHAVTGSSL